MYCYLSCVFVFGRKIPNPDLYEQLVLLIATFIVLDVLSCALLFFVVLRFQSGRDLIYHYVPQSYVVSCIGNPGTKTLVKALGVLTSLTGLGLLEQIGQNYVNQFTAETYIDVCRESGQPPKDTVIERIILYKADTCSKLGHTVIDPVSGLVKTIKESLFPPTKP